MCDKVSHNLLFQQNEIDLMLSRICTVKTELIQSCICMNMHVPWTSVLVTLFQVQSMNVFGTNVFILFVCLIASLELKYIKLLNDHALCTNFLVFYDRGNCRVFFKLLIFFFQKEFSFELHAGIICNKRRQEHILFKCHLCFAVTIIPIQYSSVRFVTCYIVFNVRSSDVHETFLTR